MGKKGLVRIHVTMSPELWDRLVEFMVHKYGRDARVTSVTVEEAIRRYLDQEAATVH